MELKLPNSIGGKRDLILAMRQVESILNDRLQDEVRERYGAKKVGTNVGEKMLGEILETNKLKDDTQTLKKILQQMEGFKQHAPQVRVAVSQEPDQDLYKRLVAWFRKEIHPGILVQIGVQPTIGGGFILTTPMRRYDFSLKTRILSSTPKFIEIMHRNAEKHPAPAPVAAAEQPQPVMAEPSQQEAVQVVEQTSSEAQS